MHPVALVGIAVDALLVLGGWALSPILGAIQLGAWLLSVIGLGCVAGGRPTVGRWLVIAGAIVFVPLGLVAVWGVTLTIDQATERAFRARRGDPRP